MGADILTWCDSCGKQFSDWKSFEMHACAGGMQAMTPPTLPTDNGASPMFEGEEEMARKFAWELANAPDTSDYHARGWNCAYAGFLRGRREALNEAAALVERKDRENSDLRQKLMTSEAECREQARLNGIGSEREAYLTAKLTRQDKAFASGVLIPTEEYIAICAKLRKLNGDS